MVVTFFLLHAVRADFTARTVDVRAMTLPGLQPQGCTRYIRQYWVRASYLGAFAIGLHAAQRGGLVPYCDVRTQRAIPCSIDFEPRLCAVRSSALVRLHDDVATFEARPRLI